MWLTQSHALPELDEQVIGISSDYIAWWTRTADCWYISDRRGQVGHRDAMTTDRSRGPDFWTHAPRQQLET